MAFGQLLTLSGTTLTDDGRTFTKSRDERASVTELSNGGIKKYIKAEGKYTFDIKWTWLPGLATQTSDQKAARNFLYALQSGTAQSFLFTISDVDMGVETYTVIINDYNEDLLRRDYIINTSFYDISLQLRTV